MPCCQTSEKKLKDLFALSASHAAMQPSSPPAFPAPSTAESFLECCLFWVVFFFAAGWTADTCSTALLLETHVHVCTLTSPFLCRAMDCECTTVAKTVGPFHKVAPKRPVASIKRRHVTMRNELFLNLKENASADSSSARYRSVLCVMRSSTSRSSQFCFTFIYFFFKLKL